MNNYHTHTYRCGHARGSEEEMVKAARMLGLQNLGFSEHVPLPHYRYYLLKSLIHCLPSMQSLFTCIKTIIRNGPVMRMPYPTRFEHQKQIQSLKDEYKNDINIYQGYECEYFEKYLGYYQSLLDNNEVDYLILGQHFNKYPIHNYYYGQPVVSDELLKQYRDDIINAIHTNLFSYIAHPDLFMLGRKKFDELCQEVAYDICKEAKKCNVPLELNAGGIRKGLRDYQGEKYYPYAHEPFFQIASEVGNDIILGIDAHSPDDFNTHDVKIMKDIAQKLNLHVIDQIEFKKGKC